MNEDEEKRPEIRFIYDDQGKVYTNVILWRGEHIQVISNPGNGTTRELQRADEIIQALIKAGR